MASRDDLAHNPSGNNSGAFGAPWFRRVQERELPRTYPPLHGPGGQ